MLYFPAPRKIFYLLALYQHACHKANALHKALPFSYQEVVTQCVRNCGRCWNIQEAWCQEWIICWNLSRFHTTDTRASSRNSSVLPDCYILACVLLWRPTMYKRFFLFNYYYDTLLSFILSDAYNPSNPRASSAPPRCRRYLTNINKNLKIHLFALGNVNSSPDARRTFRVNWKSSMQQQHLPLLFVHVHVHRSGSIWAWPTML